MEPEIIYSDRNIIALNKPPGISVHKGFSVRGPTLTDFLLEKFPELVKVGEDPERPGIVHRLDKDTSGVLIAARNQKSFLTLKDLFKRRLVEKIYLAIVCGVPRHKRGIVSSSIGRLVRNSFKRGVRQGGADIRGEREAISEYKLLKRGEKYSLLELKPRTGRMHQLRVHLKSLGHPVACDKLYGGKNVCCPPGVSRQLLHAKSISFSWPEGRRLHFEADPPEDFTVAEKQIF